MTFAVQIQTKAAQRAADDARIRAARETRTVNRVDAQHEVTHEPTKIYTLTEIVARNEARAAGLTVDPPQAQLAAATAPAVFKCRWNGDPAPDVERVRRPATKRTGAVGTMQRAQQTRVYFSAG
jgi:hypothetical protein